MAVAGAMEMLNVPDSLIFTAGFQAAVVNVPAGHNVLEGLWWRRDPGVGGFISLTSAADQQVVVALTVVGSRGASPPEISVSLAPHSTRLVDLDALTAGLSGPEQQTGGVRVAYDGNAGDIIVIGGLVNQTEGYSAKMTFWTHETGEATSLTIASVGMMVGKPPAVGFPNGTEFFPYLVLRNTTTHSMVVSLELYFAGGGSIRLPEQSLPPLDARQVNLKPLLSGGAKVSGIVNLVTTFSGASGDLIIATGSVDSSGTYVSEAIPQTVGQTLSREIPYWSVANGFDTMLSIWNPTASAQDLAIILYFGDGSGHYRMPLHLSSFASANLDIRQLISTGQPDPEGNGFPRDGAEGSLVIAAASGVTAPITIAANSGVFNVTTATCGSYCICCDGYTAISVTPNPEDCPIGETDQLHATATYDDGSTYDVTTTATWTSSNTAVATVSSSGLLTAYEAGTTTITASDQLPAPGSVCAVAPSCANNKRTFQGKVLGDVCSYIITPGQFNASACSVTAPEQAARIAASFTPASPSSCMFVSSAAATDVP